MFLDGLLASNRQLLERCLLERRDLRHWHCIVLSLEQLHQSVSQVVQHAGLVMEQYSPFVRANIDIVQMSVQLYVCEYEGRLRRVERAVDLVEDLGELRQSTRSAVDIEHLPIRCLSSLAVDWTRHMSLHQDFFSAAIVLSAPTLAWSAGRVQLQFQIQGDQRSHGFGPKHIDDVLARSLVSFGREQHDALALVWRLRHGELDTCLDAGILVQETDDLAPFSFDVALKLSASYWEVVKQVLDGDGGTLLCGDHAGSSQFAGGLKLQFGALGNI